MIEWRLKRRWGAAIALAAIVGILLLDAAAILIIRSQPVNLLSFLLGLLAALSLLPLAFLVYRSHQLLTLRYLMDRDSIIILCGGTRQLVPMQEIRSILKGKEVSDLRLPLLAWFGCWLGRGRGRTPALFYATEPPERQLLLITEASTYVLSPANPSAFLTALEIRRQMGATKPSEEKATPGVLASLPFWRDRGAQLLLVIGGALNASLFAYLAARLPDLPTILPLHFSASGGVDRIAPREEILRLPTIALIVFLTNALLGFLVHRREPLATYLLAGASILVQLLMAIAIFHIIF